MNTAYPTAPAHVPAAHAGASREPDWRFARVATLVLACIVACISFVGVALGVAAIALDRTQRDSSGFLMTSSEPFTTKTFALVSDDYRAGTAADLVVTRDALGTIRIRTQSSRPIFVGIARPDAVRVYLGNVRREIVDRFGGHERDGRVTRGSAPLVPPTAMDIWAAHSVGSGTQTLTWKPGNGRWRVVLMNADAARGVRADLAIGARFPHLLAIGLGVLGGGALLLAVSGTVIAVATRRRWHSRTNT